MPPLAILGFILIGLGLFVLLPILTRVERRKGFWL
jgi:hypothetical protein